jgi:tetratricopeptide (TPR) repeat protein
MFEQSRVYSEKAIQLFEKGPMVPHNYLWSLYIAAASCFNLGNNQKALEHAKKALNTFPNHLDSHFMLCAIALKENDLITFRRHRDAFLNILQMIKDASQDFGEIVHNTYDNEWLIRLWEVTLLQNMENNRVEIEQLIDKGRHLCGDDVRFHLEHGRLSATMDRPRDAEMAYRSVLSLDPAHGPAKTHLAGVLLDLERYNEAKSLAEEALKTKDADSILPLRVLALAHYHLDADNEALEAFQRLAHLDGSLLEPHAYLAELSLKSLDIEGCVNACDQLLKKLHLERHITIHSLQELAAQFFKIAEALLQSPEPHLFRLCLETGQRLLLMRTQPHQGKVAG